MRVCPECRQPLGPATDNGAPVCAACGWKTEVIDGFVAYAPSFARGGGGFDSTYFRELADAEAESFWFRSRNRLITWALETYHRGAASFLEVGCGTGFVLAGVRKAFPHISLSGSEIFVEGLTFARERVPDAALMQMDARKIPFENAFDTAGAFDVLEHIEEDEVVLAELWKALKPGGTLLLSVPQHPWLWSPLDDFAHHCRRYTRHELAAKVHRAGFTVLRDTSFVSLLLPAMLASRLVSRRGTVEDVDVKSELVLPGPLNTLFSGVLSAERGLIRAGLNLPLGGSRLVVARKPGETETRSTGGQAT